MDERFQIINLKFRSIIMQIKTDLDIVGAIKAHFPDFYFSPLAADDSVSFTVIISNVVAEQDGERYFVENHSINDASFVCWLNMQKKRCILSDVCAETQYDKNRLLCFFCSNLMEKLIEKEGFTALHCACVEKNGRVVAFVGDRMSGKTTAELILLNKGYNLVSNDCALFKYNAEEQSTEVICVIEDIFIREKSHFFETIWESCSQLSVAVHLSQEDGTAHRRLSLSHGDLAKINEVKWVGSGKLHAIVFSKFNPVVNTLKTSRNRADLGSIMQKHQIEIGHDSTDFLSPYFGGCDCTEILMDKFSKIPSFFCEYSDLTEDVFYSFISSIVEGG